MIKHTTKKAPVGGLAFGAAVFGAVVGASTAAARGIKQVKNNEKTKQQVAGDVAREAGTTALSAGVAAAVVGPLGLGSVLTVAGVAVVATGAKYMLDAVLKPAEPAVAAKKTKAVAAESKPAAKKSESKTAKAKPAAKTESDDTSKQRLAAKDIDMSDQYTTYRPQPGASSQEGAYMQNPQQPSYYYNDANQYGAVDAPSATAYSGQSYVGTGVEASSSSTLGSWFDFSRPEYLKGLLLGAGVALVVTNPKVQKAVVSGAVKLWAAVQGGVEEVKEQIQDAKAELSRQE